VVLLDVVADGDRILGLNTGEADGGRASVCPSLPSDGPLPTDLVGDRLTR
jgi:hypothetical protein